MIHDIPSCDQLVKRIEKEAIDTLNQASSLITDDIPHDGIAGKPVQDASENPQSEHGRVSKNVNNPEAELWGVGKSKL